MEIIAIGPPPKKKEIKEIKFSFDTIETIKQTASNFDITCHPHNA